MQSTQQKTLKFSSDVLSFLTLFQVSVGKVIYTKALEIILLPPVWYCIRLVVKILFSLVFIRSKVHCQSLVPSLINLPY